LGNWPVRPSRSSRIYFVVRAEAEVWRICANWAYGGPVYRKLLLCIYKRFIIGADNNAY
jgi:hypothetical protein